MHSSGDFAWLYRFLQRAISMDFEESKITITYIASRVTRRGLGGLAGGLLVAQGAMVGAAVGG